MIEMYMYCDQFCSLNETAESLKKQNFSQKIGVQRSPREDKNLIVTNEGPKYRIYDELHVGAKVIFKLDNFVEVSCAVNP